MIMPRLPCLPYVEVVELGRGVTELRQPGRVFADLRPVEFSIAASYESNSTMLR